MSESPYMSVKEAAALARKSPKRLYEMVREKTFVEHVHFTRPRGSQILFSRTAFVAWCEGTDGALIAAAQRKGKPRINWDVLKRTA